MKLWLSGLVLILLTACSPLSRPALTRSFRAAEQGLQDHIGFVLQDPATSRTVLHYQADRYFTPASNTKIFTLYTALTVLGDSVPALRYAVHNDSLIFAGTGDPTWLNNAVYNNTRVYDFLHRSPQALYWTDGNFYTTHFGPGWAWDDYYYAFSAERSPLPLYGNLATITQRTNGFLQSVPRAYHEHVWLADSAMKPAVVREIGNNRTDFFPARPTRQTSWRIPFRPEPLMITRLLADTLKRSVRYTATLPDSMRTLYSVPVDSVYKVMMQESDNFLAEQVLLMCSQVLSDSLKPEIAIRYMLTHNLRDLPDKPVWVDGSGLSRYNLFTPRAIAAVWQKLYTSIPESRLLALLPVGGKSGTIRRYYVNDPPFVYAKTGTVSNNHALSGFVRTKKGRILIFSYMSSNYVSPVADVRKHMEAVLRLIYEKY